MVRPGAATTPLVLRPTWAFTLSHPAHFIALGAGSGLPRVAPGTVGTLWAWAVFLLLQPLLSDIGWAAWIAAFTLLGWWASTVTARHMGVADSSHIVIDEIVAFWLVLWLVMPAGPGFQGFWPARRLRHPAGRLCGGAVHAARDRALEVLMQHPPRRFASPPSLAFGGRGAAARTGGAGSSLPLDGRFLYCCNPLSAASIKPTWRHP